MDRHFDKKEKIEGRVASDEDLKLSDTLRYVMGDTHAARRLLYRRLRCLANYENANRNLEKARAKNRDVHAAETAQLNACEKFEQISDKGKEELIDYKNRRVATFRKNLIDLADWEIKHAQSQIQMLNNYIVALNEDDIHSSHGSIAALSP